MKKLVTILVVILLASRLAQAQGTTYLSNLGQTSSGSNLVGSDSWLAALFFTGNNIGGYALNSVQLGITDASGNPNSFIVMIYDRYGVPFTIVPGDSLGTLDGSDNPSTAGIYTYTPAATLTLLPNTDYFIVLTAGAKVTDGAYDWSFMNTSSYNSDDSWTGGVTLGSSDGSSLSWGRLGVGPQYDNSQYAINATPVPEPSPSWLILLGSGVLFYACRHRKSNNKSFT